MAPGMVGVADQGDAVEMGQRLGKFMGSFMREMKTTPERSESDDAASRYPQRDSRRYYNAPESGRDYGPDNHRRNGTDGNGQRNTEYRFLPLYDPWGADRRGGDGWETSARSPYPEAVPYGWASGPYMGAGDYDWMRTRGYYGAGLAPWEAYDRGPDPRGERRWRDPSYYDPDFDPRYSEPAQGAPAPAWSSPWSGGGRRGGGPWW